jgi:hypothetical protein
MTTKTTILLGAAAGAMMLLGAGGAWAQLANCTQGQLTGAAWTTVTESTGEDSTTCYSGGSGNIVDCDSPGNHVRVTTTAGSVDTRVHQSNPNQNCVIAGSEQEGSCEIDRTGGTGSTEFGYCD